MDDLKKVNALHLYLFWKNISIALLMIAIIKVVNMYLPPFASILCTAVASIIIYVRIYLNKTSQHPTYMVVCYALMLAMIGYTVVCLITNLLDVWGVVELDDIFVFGRGDFIPALILAPIAVVSLGTCYLFRKPLHRFIDKSFNIHTDMFLKGKLGVILAHESRLQLRNLLVLFTLLTALNWTYYCFEFRPGMNSRDIYVFFWLNIIGYAVYFIYLTSSVRSINEELEENGELITPGELRNMQEKTYYRFYVVCDNRVYVDKDCNDTEYRERKVLDTPYFLLRRSTPLNETEVKKIIATETGYDNGELKFFFGFETYGMRKHVLMRYFYFLPGTPADYPDFKPKGGEWLTYEEVHAIYKKRPHSLSSYLVADTARILTISRAAAIYDENGFRKSKLKAYVPSFRLQDVKGSDVDFQSDKWINVSKFNESVPFFRLRRWLKKARRHSGAYTLI